MPTTPSPTRDHLNQPQAFEEKHARLNFVFAPVHQFINLIQAVCEFVLECGLAVSRTYWTQVFAGVSLGCVFLFGAYSLFRAKPTMNFLIVDHWIENRVRPNEKKISVLDSTTRPVRIPVGEATKTNASQHPIGVKPKKKNRIPIVDEAVVTMAEEEKVDAPDETRPMTVPQLQTGGKSNEMMTANKPMRRHRQPLAPSIQPVQVSPLPANAVPPDKLMTQLARLEAVKKAKLKRQQAFVTNARIADHVINSALVGLEAAKSMSNELSQSESGRRASPGIPNDLMTQPPGQRPSDSTLELSYEADMLDRPPRPRFHTESQSAVHTADRDPESTVFDEPPGPRFKRSIKR